jgi:hypothetical protein
LFIIHDLILTKKTFRLRMRQISFRQDVIMLGVVELDISHIKMNVGKLWSCFSEGIHLLFTGMVMIWKQA